MAFSVRDGKFDLVVVPGPRVQVWPTAGARALSSICAEVGLKVGLFGGESIAPKGIVPLPGTGGLVLAEDSQHRIHRIQTRAAVRFSLPSFFPDPFSGWRSPGVVPITTAVRLFKQARLGWHPAVAILGTGNQALRFGSALLDSGVAEVVCLEQHAQWKAKRFAGWEVERRKFEMLGGQIVEASPVELSLKKPMLWELTIFDGKKTSKLEVARVVSAGPFIEDVGLREYPPGGLLFEIEQTALANREEDVEGWMLEEERAKLIATKIVKVLGPLQLIGDSLAVKEKLEATGRRARARLKKSVRHREMPFLPDYQGKFVSRSDLKQITEFPGVPNKAYSERTVASVECFEDIVCDLCEKACPKQAIKLARAKGHVFDENLCDGCGTCASVCPAAAIVLLYENQKASTTHITFKSTIKYTWKPNQLVQLVNRKGETLGSGRVIEVSDRKAQMVKVEMPSHLGWEARGLKTPGFETDDSLSFKNNSDEKSIQEKVMILLNGEKRLVRDGISVGLALFEIGQNRAVDAFLCSDGSCSLCGVYVDGIKKLACQTEVHNGMSIKLIESKPTKESYTVCSCLGVTKQEIVDRIRQSKFTSPEAVVPVTHVGDGPCHGQSCGEIFKRILIEEGLDASNWIDWRFPWAEWKLNPAPHD